MKKLLLLLFYIATMHIACSSDNSDSTEQPNSEAGILQGNDNNEINAVTSDDTIVIKNSGAAALVTQNTDNMKPLIPNNQTPKKVIIDGSTAKNSIDIFGKYSGVLPCTDCFGINTQLKIKPNNQYELEVFYDGKSKQTTTISKGEWKWVTDFSIELVNEKNIENKFFVAENKLELLGSNGERIKGKNENRMWLKKQTY